MIFCRLWYRVLLSYLPFKVVDGRHCRTVINLSRIILCCLLLLQTSCTKTERSIATADSSNCPTGIAIPSEAGVHRLALIIGVGQYKSPKIPDLPGPPEDAKRIYELLTSPQGYGFPTANVCLLLNEQANTANFKGKFQQVLIDRAQANDEVVIYYAGHGSQAKDQNNDEQDGMDETFVFHDARSGAIKDFRDDEFEELLNRLYQKTKHITVLLDSCNSGTAMRGDVEFLSRFIPADSESNVQRFVSSEQKKKQKSGWVSSSLPGVVFFTAAGDGTSALEKNARGVFTDAILSTFGQAHASPLTYAQAARQIRPLVKAESYQIPYFQGDLQRIVFSSEKRKQSLAWEIVSLEPTIKLSGFPLPGLGKGAEFRVYDGFTNVKDTLDPEKAKATLILIKSSGLNAIGQIIKQLKNANPIKAGDIAILSRPSDDQRLLKTTLRSASLPGGINNEKIKRLKQALAQSRDANTMIRFEQNKGDFELSFEQGKYVIRGPENLVRNRLSNEEDVIKNLRAHALQRVFSSLRGEGGRLFVDQETLQVQIIPAKNQDPCSSTAKWQQQKPNSVMSQLIPACFKWNIKVSRNDKSAVRLLIGGLILSTDGSIFGFPADGTAVPLAAGEEVVFASANETFVGAPPFNIEDQVIIFGTQENNPVPWAKLTQETKLRAADQKNGLYRVLDRYISGTRGVGLDQLSESQNTETAWTLSSISMKVIEN